ncbi:TetR/AcrR family transcriptional regulator [Edaphobacter sp. 12200R-103]|uniref:TetR/AcrR family transcriptional regulator n=1 Tax=Edaphobacter sp. 12200R-103 TaxID=2703788 RepID=UPI00138C10A6|nr:TetR/AcrR family transcriptional regulator [Edaphobacter sp. 12200R-103]QHS51818.1 TetR/AcrR family transcriptional regulator [Edaphobacter sp. 12200R-103]
MAKKTDERRRQVMTEFRRSEILEAATKVFGAKGYEGTRVDDIAAEAGLAKATVYVYFESKDEIYQETVEQALAELAELTDRHVAAEQDFAGKVRAFISVRISFWKEKQALYHVISSLNREMPNRRRSLNWQKKTVDYLTVMFSTAAERGEIEGRNLEASAWALMDIVRGINERRIVNYGRSSEEEIDFVTTLVLRALGWREES